MTATVAGLVTPHLLRVVDLANEAEKGVNVTWHVRDAVARTMEELGQQYNAPALVAAFVDGLEAAAAQAAPQRVAYIGALRAAATAARGLARE
ncbi:MAG: hypothetical protein ACTHKZ_03270 [Lysobacteraceae bacterium]